MRRERRGRQGVAPGRVQVLRAMDIVLDALAPVLRTDDCGFEAFSVRHKAGGDARPIEDHTQLVLTYPRYKLFHVPHEEISGKQIVHASHLI